MAISTHRSARYNVTLAHLFKLIIAMSQQEQEALLIELEARRQTADKSDKDDKPGENADDDAPLAETDPLPDTGSVPLPSVKVSPAIESKADPSPAKKTTPPPAAKAHPAANAKTAPEPKATADSTPAKKTTPPPAAKAHPAADVKAHPAADVKTAPEPKANADSKPAEKTDLPPDTEKVNTVNRHAPDKAVEERADVRKNCLLAVDCASGNKVVTDFVADISSGGMFIRTSEKYAVGQTLQLSFAFFRDQRPLKISATVARQTKDGIGVKFESLTPYQRNVLKATVARMKTKQP